MVATFRVFKKESPNGKITLYLGQRDFVDHYTHVDPIDGVIVIDPDYLKARQIYGQVIVTFRYGREEDEVMGLHFYRDLFLASEQIYPQPEKKFQLTRMQERLVRKLGPNAFPFHFQLPQTAPSSVTLQSAPDEHGKPCGVEYTLKMFAGESAEERGHKRSTVALRIRKIQYAPSKQGRQPCTVVRKDFLLSPGQLELEVTLDKQLYYHGESISMNVSVKNQSNKTVKKIRAAIVQVTDISMFINGQYKTVVSSVETQEGCPIGPSSNLQKVMKLTPLLQYNRDKRGVALDGQLKHQNTNLASSTLFLGDDHEAFGIVVSYMAKVKLYLGAIGGELTAELPLILMHPKPDPKRMIRADSQAEVEQIVSSRQNTFDAIDEEGSETGGQADDTENNIFDDFTRLQATE